MLIIVRIVTVIILSIIYFSYEESKTKPKSVPSWNRVYEFNKLNDLQRTDNYGNNVTDVKCIVTNHKEQTCEFYFDNGGGGAYIWMSKTNPKSPLTTVPICGAGTLPIGGLYCLDPQQSLEPNS